ncbi:flagellar hook-length control protein FliK [Roseicyclus sp.]|uniref:flagellar hook-length control protein FliK n=1 Tax=Roseicyclus sp. TaxID=1914329 RepID=UPI0040545D5C
MSLLMKAIVNSMDLKAVEPGLHARAAKPGGTALFDPLFAMTSAPVSDETSMAAEVGAEVLPDDPQTPSASWLVEVGAANPAPGFTVPAAQSMDPKVVQAALAAAVPTKTDTTLENGQLSGEATPLSWLVYEQQAAASGQKGAGFVGPLADGVVAAQLQVTEMTPVTQAPSPLPDAMSPQAEQLSDVPLIQLSSVDAMSPQAEQLADGPLIQLSSADAVSKMAFAHLTAQQLADSAALHMTDTVAMKANPVLASGEVQNVSRLAHAEDVAPMAAEQLQTEVLTPVDDPVLREISDPTLSILADEAPKNEGHSTATLGKSAELDEVAVRPLNPKVEVLPSLDEAKVVSKRAEVAANIVDRAIAPREASSQALPVEQGMPKAALDVAQAKTPIAATLIGGQKKPLTERAGKLQPDALAMQPTKGEQAATPTSSAVLSTRPDMMMVANAMQEAKIVVHDHRRADVTDSKPAGEATLGRETAMLDLVRGAAERSEPVVSTHAAPRPTHSAQPVVPAVPPAMAPAATLNMRQADWGKQLVGHIERMAANGSQRIELSLRPKNLGEIRVMLDLRGDQTLVHLVTETTAAARLLSGAEDRLAQVLDQSGYRLSGFSANEQGASAQSGQQGQQGQPSPRRNRPAIENAKRDEPTEAATTSAYGADRNQSTGINMLA